MIEFFEKLYKLTVKMPKTGWLPKFQHNPYKHKWPEICEKLLKQDNEFLEKFMFINLINSIDPESIYAISTWGIQRAVSLAAMQDIYDKLNVKLTVNDVVGESFYMGFPLPTDNDVELGKKLLEIKL